MKSENVTPSTLPSVICSAGVRCNHVITAMSTNGAASLIRNEQCVNFMQQAIVLSHQWQANEIVSLPALHSTVAANKISAWVTDRPQL